MLVAFLLSLREGLEATLILGIVLGVLRKLERPDLKPAVWAGTLSAVLASLLTGGLLTVLGFSLEGKAEEIFEGVTMLLAAGILTWMIFWMNRQGQRVRTALEGNVRRAAAGSGGRRAVFWLAFLVVVREGVELALFLTAAALLLQSNLTLPGALLGLGTAVLLGWLFFAAVIQLNLRSLFRVTGALLLLFAAGLVAHGVHEFNEVGWIPPLIEPVWNLNPWLDENSFGGQMLKALFGYNGNPSLTEVLAYLAYLGAILLGLKWSSQPAERQLEPPRPA